MASNTTQPTVGLLLLAALIVAALGTRPGTNASSDNTLAGADPESNDAQRPDAKTLRDLAGLSVGLDALRQLGAMIESAPSVAESIVEAATPPAEQIASGLDRAADLWRNAAMQMLASQPSAEEIAFDGTPLAELATEEASEEVTQIAARLGLMQSETLRAWGANTALALAAAPDRAIERLTGLGVTGVADAAEALVRLLDRAMRASAPISSSMRLFAAAGTTEQAAPAETASAIRPAPVTQVPVTIAPAPVIDLPAIAPAGHGGWWSPMGSDLPGFENGWHDGLTDAMLPVDHDNPHAR